jgi:hypothetical protein
LQSLCNELCAPAQLFQVLSTEIHVDAWSTWYYKRALVNPEGLIG